MRPAIDRLRSATVVLTRKNVRYASAPEGSFPAQLCHSCQARTAPTV